MGKHMEIVMLEFKDWCGLSDEHGGNIIGTCTFAFQTQHSFCKKINYHKIRDNSIVAHVVLDVSHKVQGNDSATDSLCSC